MKISKENINFSLIGMLVGVLICLAIAFHAKTAKAEEFQNFDVEIETELEAMMDGEEIVEPQNYLASASGEKAPAPFQDSEITRELEDGKTQKFDGNKYMIVRRGAKKKPVKAKVVEKKVVKYKNRINLLAGNGPSGDIDVVGTRASTEHEPIVGLSYQRLLNERLSIGIQVQTNETVLGSVGLDF